MESVVVVEVGSTTCATLDPGTVVVVLPVVVLVEFPLATCLTLVLLIVPALGYCPLLA